jgi:hypothetical protein
LELLSVILNALTIVVLSGCGIIIASLLPTAVLCVAVILKKGKMANGYELRKLFFDMAFPRHF